MTLTALATEHSHGDFQGHSGCELANGVDRQKSNYSLLVVGDPTGIN